MAFSCDIPCILACVAIAVLTFLVIRLRATQTAIQNSTRELARLELTLELAEGVGRFGSWHLDTNTENVKWSEYVFDMHARPHSKGEPTLGDAIKYYHPDDRIIVENYVARAISDGEDFDFRARIITERGEDIPVLSRGTCQFGRNGEVIGIFGCLIDMSSPSDP